MRGQAAFEYLILFSIALLLLGILVWYSQEMTESNRNDMTVANAITAVNKIVDAANIVYTQGNPSQITLSVYIPERVISIDFIGNTIAMKVQIGSQTSDIIASSKAPLQGNIPTSSGTKKIKIIAEENYVNITQG
ncbi:MAG: hypothetical protein JW700_03530 [Candidatus Aenigmarchaeota archaeon]|nr:hypothetical protein [Candidatus Aenigmarchaeota archaeon]